MLTILMWIARLYVCRWSHGGKRAGFYSINVMRVQHPHGASPPRGGAASEVA
jgi:NADPH:quinone reductase